MAGKLRAMFSDEDIIKAYNDYDGNIAKAAKALSSRSGKVTVNRTTLRYWLSQLDNSLIDSQLGFAKTEQQKRTAQVENNRLRKIARDVLDAERTKEDVLNGIRAAVADLKMEPVVMLQPTGANKMTVEILFSDLQIGKLMSDYDSEVAVKRLIEYIEVIKLKINQSLVNYDIEKIIFAMIGDIIESDKKHINSARATDSGTATQMERAIRFVSTLVIKPLAKLGIPMDIICVTGNHDHDGHGLMMFKPGREQLSWPMYHALKMIHDAYGHSHLTWYIPEGAFHVHDIYGFKVLYEHGVGVAASEASMRKRLSDRSSQLKQYITMFRMGDKHNICRFNNDAMVVNGAFFGDDREGTEYSGICGYDGYPAQLVFFHVPRNDNFRLPIYDSLVVQLGHIK